MADPVVIFSLDEKLSFIAKAILHLSEKSARTWDYDGDAMIGEGVDLPPVVEAGLKAMLSAAQVKQP